jgi:hypothetical protein
MALVARSLTPAEVALYDHIPPELAARARLHRVRALASGAHGMTLGRHVLLVRGHETSPKLIAHELVHVRQYAEKGFVRFLVRYLLDYGGNLLSTRADLSARHRQQRMPVSTNEQVRTVTDVAYANKHRAAYLAITAEMEARQEADRWEAEHG